ncbi:MULTISPECIES: helix-turn-helix domain-containing protein [unclassified Corynebacterium]|uniref:helix-turn-helix domain-containing protein n=1 Tax=unclassified Corynebacterium TaxID=2624378 RepID=UPI0029CA6348|nr:MULTISPECIES: helix-turn-helix domain-containing protein [unclassified Corynebacterium]WPF66890.1 helix-turn-helix domain-containing protein [Corynebacterium sp. 22KM0430]WPF69378.1 helix-turn-helix domain-containing protein [Corynebacterium sp. 21KM1197]
MSTAVRHSSIETTLPNEAESAQILDLVKALEDRGETIEAQPAIITADGTRHDIPGDLSRILLSAAKTLANGQGVTIVARHRLLTTQEAADMLNISRPTLIKILDEGAIPFEMRGSHRRIRLQHVINYQEALQTRRAEALDRMQSQGQADGIYDILDTTVDED